MVVEYLIVLSVADKFSYVDTLVTVDDFLQ